MELTGNFNQDIIDLHRAKQLSEDFKLLHYEIKKEDQTKEAVSKAEKEYFRQNIQGLAISRKLSLVSQWSLRYQASSTYDIRRNSNAFVADRKLWRWIDRCLSFEGKSED